MKEAGYSFVVKKPDVDESFSASMNVELVPSYLARKKAEVFSNEITNEIVLASDTVVVLNGIIMNKPTDRQEAFAMLTALSWKTHTVITAVCLLSKEKIVEFDDNTDVTFKVLSHEEIYFYIDTYKPFDKAGAYGAQDWIGMVAIEKINGSYFTVMGLPMHKVYKHLAEF